jgi:precorrin-6B methylase 2
MTYAATLPRAALAAAAALAWLGGAAAQDRWTRLDVPYVPTPHDVVARMLDMADVKRGEFLIDLGSGDGRIAIAAAKRGARAYGVDLNPVRIKEARENAAEAKLTEDQVRFEEKNLFDTDISKADVLTMYLLPSVNLQLRPRILSDMRPGARIVSHSFDMGDWLADRSDEVRSRVIYFWLVPARVDGRWQVESGAGSFALEIKQQYQTFSATAHSGDRALAVRDAKIAGAEISFTVDLGKGAQTFAGRVDKDSIAGTSPAAWKATRAK